MKKLLFTILITSLMININAQLKVLSNGQLEIPASSTMSKVIIDASGGGHVNIRPSLCGYGWLGMSQMYWGKLYVNEAYYNLHSSISSDERLKMNIQTIDTSSLHKFTKLRGVQYQRKADQGSTRSDFMNSSETFKKPISSDTEFGFIAQDLIKVYPQVVDYDTIADKYFIKYTELIPILTEAIKEQQKLLDLYSKTMLLQEEAIITLRKDVEELKANVLINKGIDKDKPNNCFLTQNQPNPFQNSTSVQYKIQCRHKTASVIVADVYGNKMTEYSLKDNEGQLEISSKGWKQGIYYYTLIADNKIVETKIMLLGK